MLACALTGLLVSPLSWDHHWVWVAPGIALLAHLGARARGAVRAAWWAAGGALVLVFGAWPQFWDLSQSRADPGRAVLVRARDLLRDRRPALVSRVPLAWPAAAGGQHLRAGRAGRAGRPVRGRVPGEAPACPMSSRACASGWPTGWSRPTGSAASASPPRCTRCRGTCSCPSCRPRRPTATTRS